MKIKRDKKHFNVTKHAKTREKLQDDTYASTNGPG